MVLCNEKPVEYGPLLPLAQQISLKSDSLLEGHLHGAVLFPIISLVLLLVLGSLFGAF